MSDTKRKNKNSWSDSKWAIVKIRRLETSYWEDRKREHSIRNKKNDCPEVASNDVHPKVCLKYIWIYNHRIRSMKIWTWELTDYIKGHDDNERWL